MTPDATALVDLRLRHVALRTRLRELEARIVRLRDMPGCPCDTCRGVRALRASCGPRTSCESTGADPTSARGPTSPPGFPDPAPYPPAPHPDPAGRTPRGSRP